MNPGTSQAYEVVLTSSTKSLIASVTFRLTFMTPSNNTVTVATISVQVSS